MWHQLIWLALIILSLGNIKLDEADSVSEDEDAITQNWRPGYFCQQTNADQIIWTKYDKKLTKETCVDKCVEDGAVTCEWVPPDRCTAYNKPLEMYSTQHSTDSYCMLLKTLDSAVQENKPDSAVQENKPDSAVQENKPDWKQGYLCSQRFASDIIRIEVDKTLTKETCFDMCVEYGAVTCGWTYSDTCQAYNKPLKMHSTKLDAYCMLLKTDETAVDGGWSVWSGYGLCSQTCGTGQQKRTRSCDHPSPSNGGKPCSGDKVDYQQCNIGKCPACPINGNTETGKCCVFPFYYEGRQYDRCITDRWTGRYWCAQTSTYEYNSSQWSYCTKVNGGWSQWRFLDRGRCMCSRNGNRRRIGRMCNNPTPANGGEPCNGVRMRYKYCSGRCYLYKG